MTVSLGSIVLDGNLRLDGLHDSPGIAGSARPTMGGVVLQTMPMADGRVLSLVATRNGMDVVGLYTQAQVEAICALRDSGASVALIHHLGTFTVFLPPNAVQVEQVFDHADPGADAWYIGTITMITVE